MKSVRINFLYNVGYQVLALALPLITMPYISRVLGKEGIGIYSYNYAIANYFVLFIMLGLNNYGSRTIASSRDNKNLVSKNFINIYAMQIICGFIFISIYLIYCIFISKNTILSLIFLLYVLSAIFDINWFFFGLEEFKLTVTRNTLIKLVSTILIFILVKSKDDIYFYCFIMVGSILVSQIALWPFLKGKIEICKPDWEEIKNHIKPNLLLFITVLLTSLFKVMDKIMLGIMSSVDEVGLYEASEKIVNIPISLITALGTVMLPRISNMMARNDENTISYTLNSIVFAIFISSSMCFGIMAVSDEFVPIFYGQGFETCTILYLILLPSCIFLAFANVIRTQYLLPKKMDKEYIISAALGAIINVIINLLLIPKYGSIGAAIGTFAAEMIVCLYQTWAVRTGLPIKIMLKKSSILVLDGLIMFIIVRSVSFFTMNILTNLLFKIILGVIIYILLCFVEWIIYKKIYGRNYIVIN